MRGGTYSAALSTTAMLLAAASSCSSFGTAEERSAEADGPPSVDASASGVGRDAGPSADSGAGCAHTFCARFEEDPPEEGWTGTYIAGQGTVIPVAAADRGGRVLLATTPSVTVDGEDHAACLSRAFQGGNGAHVELDVKIAPVPMPNEDFAIVEIGSQERATVGVTLYVSPHLAFNVARGSGGFQYLPAPSGVEIPHGRWVHVTVDVVLGPTGSLKLEVDRSVVIDTALTTDQLGAPLALFLGLQRFEKATPRLEARYDDLTLDLR